MIGQVVKLKIGYRSRPLKRDDKSMDRGALKARTEIGLIIQIADAGSYARVLMTNCIYPAKTS